MVFVVRDSVFNYELCFPSHKTPIKFPCTADFGSSTAQGQADKELESPQRAVSHLTLFSAAKPALNQLK